MSTLTLKQLTDRQTIALTERSDIDKIASLFDSIPRPYYFARQSNISLYGIVIKLEVQITTIVAWLRIETI